MVFWSRLPFTPLRSALLLAAALLLAGAPASALQLRVIDFLDSDLTTQSNVSIEVDNGANFSHDVVFGDFDDFELTCTSASSCTVEDFWFGRGITHFVLEQGGGGGISFAALTGGALGTTTGGAFDNTLDIALTLAGGQVTGSSPLADPLLYFEGYQSAAPPPFVGGLGTQWGFQFFTDSTMLPGWDGTAMTAACPDSLGTNTVPAGEVPQGVAFTDGFNQGSQGRLVAVGCYTFAGSLQGPLLLTLNVEVVPEPSTALLLTGGLGGLAWVGRRRRLS
ncbi:MAG: PEP-CTERM sorting domain-containing protein [Myxococcales bacterium]|nr:PEP-CTERM sorting domain-containing protein [Myxococcales bacterium]